MGTAPQLHPLAWYHNWLSPTNNLRKQCLHVVEAKGGQTTSIAAYNSVTHQALLLLQLEDSLLYCSFRNEANSPDRTMLTQSMRSMDGLGGSSGDDDSK